MAGTPGLPSGTFIPQTGPPRPPWPCSLDPAGCRGSRGMGTPKSPGLRGRLLRSQVTLHKASFDLVKSWVSRVRCARVGALWKAPGSSNTVAPDLTEITEPRGRGDWNRESLNKAALSPYQTQPSGGPGPINHVKRWASGAYLLCDQLIPPGLGSGNHSIWPGNTAPM